jgi:hypothetical protein
MTGTSTEAEPSELLDSSLLESELFAELELSALPELELDALLELESSDFAELEPSDFEELDVLELQDFLTSGITNSTFQILGSPLSERTSR